MCSICSGSTLFTTHLAVAVVKIWDLVNYMYRSRYIHCPQVVTDLFRDMLTKGPSVQTQQTQVPSCTPCSTTKVCNGLIIEQNISLLAYTSHPRLVTNRVDPDQTPYSAVSVLGPHCQTEQTVSCHAHLAAQSGSALFRIQIKILLCANNSHPR